MCLDEVVKMNPAEYFHKLRHIAAHNKISVDTTINVGDDYYQLVTQKSDPQARTEAKEKLHEFYADNGEVEIDRGILCKQLGLKNTNADRQWLSHQLKVLRIGRTEMPAAAD
jgi:hypothetical protein